MIEVVISVLPALAIVVAILGTVAFIVGYLKAKTAEDTINNYKKLRESDAALQDSYGDRILDLEKKQNEAEKAVAELSHQVNVLKTIPLAEIARTQEQLAEVLSVISKNQLLIMDKLEVTDKRIPYVISN